MTTKTWNGTEPVTDAHIEGVVRCYCGVKYWENLTCVDCGQKINDELLAQLDEQKTIGLEAALDKVQEAVNVLRAALTDGVDVGKASGTLLWAALMLDTEVGVA
jgi:hypothetical protein